MDRVGVFARSDGIQPSDADQAWWSNNNCTTAPTATLDHPYFMVSKALDEVYVPASVDPERVIQVTAVISGLESYAAANGTYTVTGGGHNGNGQGWFHFSAGSYPASIFAVLSSHLTSVPSDPLHTNVSAFSRDDFLIYRCMDLSLIHI